VTVGRVCAGGDGLRDSCYLDAGQGERTSEKRAVRLEAACEREGAREAERR
jgi:hypothetical protein